MSIAKTPSKITLPERETNANTVLEYLIFRFPAISAEIWHQRVKQGKVHWHSGQLITTTSRYQAKQRVYYYREVENEIEIPFLETIVFQDEHILVAHKPHFLPVTPGGKYVDQCLQERLRKTTGIETLQALHRLDRATAGLVLFSTNPGNRPLYHNLFEQRQIHKSYLAIARTTSNQLLAGKSWILKNRIEKSGIRFRMHIVPGQANSHSIIRCLQQGKNSSLFELTPITGKTHQLRLHMQTLGWPILNDRTYPILQPEKADDHSQPLQLLAHSIRFIDPITLRERYFKNKNTLAIK